jgi:drug/metabolite transporter (DMT)-like permease
MASLSAVAFSIWTTLLKHNKVSSITVFNFLIPVVGTFLSALILGESIFRLQYLLALPFVVAGIVLVTYSSSKTPV